MSQKQSQDNQASSQDEQGGGAKSQQVVLTPETLAADSAAAEIGAISSTMHQESTMLQRTSSVLVRASLARLSHATITRTDSNAGNTLPRFDKKNLPHEIIKPTFKRYIIMLLFCFNAGNKAFQWIQVPAATTKATVLYGVDNYVINLASILFMMSFVVLSWPACYIIETVGIRKAVLTASFGTMIGAIIKCFSCHEEGVWLLMLGSIIVSLSEQLIFSVPSRLASVWFPDSQVSLCVAMCVVGNQVGVALGFLVPHWYLNDAETRQEIGMGFYQMFIATAVYSIIVFVLCVVMFAEEPKHAPGAARLRQRQLELALKGQQTKRPLSEELGDLFRQIFSLCHNKQLMLLAMSYGIVVGVNYAIQTLLDQMIGPVWPDDTLLVGQAGFIIVVAGVVTTPLWGRAMDAWHGYKLINVLIALGNVLSMAAFGFALICQHSTLSIYLTSLLYGLFSVGFCVSALEYAVELTYPAPELVTSSIMNVVPQIMGTIFILLGSYLVDNFGPLVANSFNVGVLALGLLLVMVTKEELKRQAAINQTVELANGVKSPKKEIHPA